MAFRCDLRLPLQSKDGTIPGPVQMSRVIVYPFKMVAKNDLLFIVETPAGAFEIRSNMDGALTALKPREGEIISEDEQFGAIGAEGENIPYGQPYVWAISVTQP